MMDRNSEAIVIQTPVERWIGMHLRLSAFICGSLQFPLGAKGTIKNIPRCSDKPISNSKWAS